MNINDCCCQINATLLAKQPTFSLIWPRPETERRVVEELLDEAWAVLKYVLISAGLTAIVFAILFTGSQTRMSGHKILTPPPLDSTAIFAMGRIEGETQEIGLRPQLSGRIVQVLIQEGQSVERGQVLLRLDDRRQRYEVALASAELDLAQAQLERLLNGARAEEREEAQALHRAKMAELEQAQLTWKRTQPLRLADAVSQQEADNQQSRVNTLTSEVAAARARLKNLQSPARKDEVKMAHARINAAKARLELASVELDRTNLRAPIRGQVLQITVEVGELCGPTSAEAAIVMADTSRYRVCAFVEELDAPRVTVGSRAIISADGLPGQEFSCFVSRVSPRMGRKMIWSDRPAERIDTKTREIWLDLEDSTPFVVGLRVDVVIDSTWTTEECVEPTQQVSRNLGSLDVQNPATVGK